MAQKPILIVSQEEYDAWATAPSAIMMRAYVHALADELRSQLTEIVLGNPEVGAATISLFKARIEALQIVMNVSYEETVSWLSPDTE